MANDVDDYSVDNAEQDPGEWREKRFKTDGCPQRGNQPKLDLSPEGDDYYDSRNTGKNFYTDSWTDQTGTYGTPTDHKGPNHHYDEPYSERKVGSKPQDFRGSANPFKPEGDKALDSWFASQSIRFTDKADRDYRDDPAIDNNKTVPQRTDWKTFEHGWQVEPSEALPSGESGANHSASRSIGSTDKPRGAKD